MVLHATDQRPVRRVSAVTASGAQSDEAFDPVVVEAPLSVMVNGEAVATTMRTPGHDEELAVGWLVSETDLSARSDLMAVERVGAAVAGALDAAAVDTVSLSLIDSVVPPRPRA